MSSSLPAPDQPGHELLSLLGFEATVTESGDMKAFVAVPAAPQIISSTGRTWACSPLGANIRVALEV